MAGQSINERQDEIIADFSMLEGDLEMTNFYLIELGQKLPELTASERTEKNIVKGCQSKVWLTAELKEGKIYYKADSNTTITKGLVSLLVRIFSGQSSDEIMNAELYFVERIGMNRFIGTQRSNGFAAMLKQIKMYALAYSGKGHLY